MLLNCNPIDLFQAGNPFLDFVKSSLTKIDHPLYGGLIRDLHRVAAFHNDSTHGVRYFHDLEEADTALVPVIATLAAFRPEDRKLIEISSIEAFLFERFTRNIFDFLAVIAKFSCEALSNN